ncbi:Exopolysaccharide biosynthesis glycosyltransferase EpsF [Vibrio cholerae]|jgi:glycosyltransferase involved in cell wall biosynthesis|uniref:glycosyltransferase n=1 Tax=Vibrio cholerae TaxID=666 RepID=UPI0011DC38BA|nr:glycosyltransferase [Vibrio cholerae]TXZ35556.1 glycosyltransferase family 4 protein [Vibrio cholerae]GHZ88248.1 Exopolysaccharide biosynthesis glycosyltransferase EpsF [Vibrio cholerae]
MKRICFVNTSISWGGGEKWHSVAAKLCSDCADVTVIAHPKSKLQAHIASQNINVFKTRISNLSFLNPLKIYELYRHFKQQQYDTVVLNLPSDAKCAGLAAKLAGIRKIIYRRGMPHPIKNNVINRYLFSNIITNVIVNSEEIGHSIIKNNIHMIDQSKIHTIYNGVNLADYQSEIPPSVVRKGSEIILGTTGRCVAQKNQLMLVDMVKELKQRGYDIKLYLAGTGPLLENIKQHIEQLELQESIILLGFVADTRPLLSGLDIFVFPSHYEGSANAIIEAMAMGLPIVSFDVSSMPEMVKHNQNGKLAKYNNNTDFTDQVEMLLTDEKLRKQLGINSRKMAEAQFDNCLIFNQIKQHLLDS